MKNKTEALYLSVLATIVLVVSCIFLTGIELCYFFNGGVFVALVSAAAVLWNRKD